MHIVQAALIVFIILEHLGFLILEMFLWTKPLGLKIFRQSLEKAQISKALAANQGLYNGFLAAGLFTAWQYGDRAVSYHFVTMFLMFVLIAGLYGGYSVSKRIWINSGFAGGARYLLAVLFQKRIFSCVI